MTGCGESITKAEKVNVRLEPWTNPKGKQIKMLYIDWKNVGNTPIRVLSADMTFYDANGNVVDSIQDCAIYACWKGESGIAPGESYIVPTGKGFFVHDPTISTAKAEIKTPKSRGALD